MDLSEISCAHVVACIWYRQEDPIDYVSTWYKKECYLMTYGPAIAAIQSQDQSLQIEKHPLAMPPEQTKPGRPKRL